MILLRIPFFRLRILTRVIVTRRTLCKVEWKREHNVGNDWKNFFLLFCRLDKVEYRIKKIVAWSSNNDSCVFFMTFFFLFFRHHRTEMKMVIIAETGIESFLMPIFFVCTRRFANLHQIIIIVGLMWNFFLLLFVVMGTGSTADENVTFIITYLWQ